MRYFRSTDFYVHLLVLWWVLWIAVSFFELSVFPRPSTAVLAQFIMFIFFFFLGYLSIRILRGSSSPLVSENSSIFKSDSFRMKFVIRFTSLSCLFALIYSLYLSGGLSTSFIEYFLMLRKYELEGYLTGSKYLDIATKLIIFPASYSLIVLILSVGIHKFKIAFAVLILNLLLFSYLWQVNYPMVYLFWLIVFFVIIQLNRGSSVQWRNLLLIFSLVIILIFSSINRFGGDFLGAVQYYFVDYHLVGFSFYDYQFNNPNSILHAHSYGRSSLGFIDQLADLFSRIVGLSYKAASFDNLYFNALPVNVGASDGREVNAFGTFLFGLYRDFNLAGIAIGGYLYGACITYTVLFYRNSWVSRALFMILATAWMTGMLVDPLEQGHFWFAILFIGLLKVVNKGFRLGLSSNQMNLVHHEFSR